MGSGDGTPFSPVNVVSVSHLDLILTLTIINYFMSLMWARTRLHRNSSELSPLVIQFPGGDGVIVKVMQLPRGY